MNTVKESLKDTLTKAQRLRKPVLSDSCAAPQDLTQAYQIQRSIFCVNNKGLGAWKLGRLGDSSVFCAPIYAADIFKEGDKLPAHYQNACHVEAEVAVKLNRGIKSTDKIELGDIANYFSEVCCAIEILDSRFTDWQETDSLYHIADRNMNGAIALGKAQQITTLEDYQQQSFTLTINDELISSGENLHPEADLPAALWGFVQRAQASGYDLECDSWVTTGSWSGYPVAKVGDKIKLNFSRLGDLSIEL
jgi:2-keto-4-pentenoate hydratase